MSRIVFADVDAPDIRPLAERIAADRGSVLDLYKILLHSPPVAAGWLHCLSAIRQECILSAQLRELVIMRVAILNGASYEAEQHAPLAVKAGLTVEQLQELDRWQTSTKFNAEQRAVLAYTDSMTREIHVPRDVFASVRARFNERSLVELTATIAAYNMVSRFLEALEIRAER